LTDPGDARPVRSVGVGELDGRGAREELWRRYDAGALDAKQLEARLRAVDRAGDEPTLRQALDAPLTTTDPRRRMFLVAGIAVLLVVAIAVPLVVLDGDPDDALAVTSTTGGDVPPVTPPPVPAVIPAFEECDELDDAIAATEAAAIADLPANPSLLSDPPSLPEGYAVDDDEDLVPGTDPDIAMQINAGSPLPVEIRARTLSGELDVNIRSFRYASVDDAVAAGRSVIGSGVCTYGAEGFPVPDHPELTGSVVSGPIPTTAFVGFRYGDRRFTVAVVADDDPTTGQASDEALEAAKALAGTIAALELDAARSPSGPGEQQVGTVPPTLVPSGPTVVPATTIPG
jgi:hypothetical protein